MQQHEIKDKIDLLVLNGIPEVATIAIIHSLAARIWLDAKEDKTERFDLYFKEKSH